MSDLYMFKLNGQITLIKHRVKRERHLITKKGCAECSWCHMFISRPISAVVVKGVSMDLVTCMCYCPHCELGTIVIYEIPMEPGERLELQLPASTR